MDRLACLLVGFLKVALVRSVVTEEPAAVVFPRDRSQPNPKCPANPEIHPGKRKSPKIPSSPTHTTTNPSPSAPAADASPCAPPLGPSPSASAAAPPLARSLLAPPLACRRLAPPLVRCQPAPPLRAADRPLPDRTADRPRLPQRNAAAPHSLSATAGPLPQRVAECPIYPTTAAACAIPLPWDSTLDGATPAAPSWWRRGAFFEMLHQLLLLPQLDE
ncbi:predicted GPI-anchored protein 58 [Triticum aestivum]|uniref:predicted GPI-anchored protein 58 n=1 Tax=Triticum aestivum TaxID=4565 RepID=UPI001D018E15|nr:predicted GPI-anchored protein 58 [Triticum aestivum]